MYVCISMNKLIWGWLIVLLVIFVLFFSIYLQSSAFYNEPLIGIKPDHWNSKGFISLMNSNSDNVYFLSPVHIMVSFSSIFQNLSYFKLTLIGAKVCVCAHLSIYEQRCHSLVLWWASRASQLKQNATVFPSTDIYPDEIEKAPVSLLQENEHRGGTEVL